jgi:hypothetical protein
MMNQNWVVRRDGRITQDQIESVVSAWAALASYATFSVLDGRICAARLQASYARDLIKAFGVRAVRSRMQFPVVSK